MREILFKAKRKDWRKLPKKEWWVEGDLIQTTFNGIKRMWISSEEYDNARLRYVHKYVTEWRGIEIDPTTLCQYTGLTDKNGQKIWENDICDRKEKYPEIVTYNKGDWQLDYSYVFGKGIHHDACNLGFYACERNCVNVIGNIFDDKELLEVE